MLVCILDHHNRGIHHRADRNRNSAQAHDVGIHAQRAHRDDGDQHADGQHHDGHQRTARMHQKHHAHQRDDEAFFQQRALQGFDGAMDQIGTVIYRLDTHAFRKARGHLGNFAFDVLDHLQRVLPIARHDDAGHHFTFAVQLGEAAPFIRAKLDTRNVADQHRCAHLRLDYQILDVALAA